MTHGQLLEKGYLPIEGQGRFDCLISVLGKDGEYWCEQPSRNGNGWYAGDINDQNNLCYVYLGKYNADQDAINAAWKHHAAYLK